MKYWTICSECPLMICYGSRAAASELARDAAASHAETARHFVRVLEGNEIATYYPRRSLTGKDPGVPPPELPEPA